jgi:hypothetical protein
MPPVNYCVGTPCDTPCAICYFDSNQLVPLDEITDSALLDKLHPIVHDMVVAEYGEEAGVMRTCQTLTLVGDFHEDDEDEEGEDDVEDVLNEATDIVEEKDDNKETIFANEEDGGEEVEVIMTFEHEGKEYSLVKMLDPVMLVAKEIKGGRFELLTDDEGEKVIDNIEKSYAGFLQSLSLDDGMDGNGFEEGEMVEAK